MMRASAVVAFLPGGEDGRGASSFVAGFSATFGSAGFAAGSFAGATSTVLAAGLASPATALRDRGLIGADAVVAFLLLRDSLPSRLILGDQAGIFDQQPRLALDPLERLIDAVEIVRCGGLEIGPLVEILLGLVWSAELPLGQPAEIEHARIVGLAGHGRGEQVVRLLVIFGEV